MRRSAVPLSYRVILVGMIGGAHLISVRPFFFVDIQEDSNLRP